LDREIFLHTFTINLRNIMSRGCCIF